MIFVKKIKKKFTTGFMTMEILVATSIITLSILATTAVVQKSAQVSRQALHSVQAISLLEETGEIIRILRDNGWDNISSLSVSTNYYPIFLSDIWKVSTEASSVDIFTRKFVVSNVNRSNTTFDIVTSGGILDPKTKLINVDVFWLEGGITVTKSLSFYIIDIFS
jgi:Tfp pilus assembly protein PilV